MLYDLYSEVSFLSHVMLKQLLRASQFSFSQKFKDPCHPGAISIAGNWKGNKPCRSCLGRFSWTSLGSTCFPLINKINLWLTRLTKLYGSLALTRSPLNGHTSLSGHVPEEEDLSGHVPEEEEFGFEKGWQSAQSE